MTKSLFDNPPLQQPQVTAAPIVQQPQPAPAPAPSSLVPLTQDEVKRALPQHLRASVTQGIVDTLNQISTDPIVAENIRDNFIGYSAILKEGKFKTEDYINAVAYVSYKLMGHSNEDAYARTFPTRYSLLLSKGASKKDISAYVSAFHRGKLVNLVMEQSLVPTWVLNQDLAQKAINQLATLMVSANSEKVQADAAIGLLNHLKKPEPKGDFQINLNQAESSGMKEMRDMLGRLASQQRDLIEQGTMKTIDVAASRLINKVEATDVE
ncbi:hypothetical protein NKJ04_17465 [Mesorhizobium sp. M0618]|uniref:hypothetical protein n=1 Tax=Mesorhizobium sp. M0618 TaxID=2956972 RepID=UPI00333D3D3D